MATLVIPVRNDLPAYEFRIDLESVTYTMRFRYNLRMQRWIMDLADGDGEDIIAGIPILINLDLLRQYSRSNLPPGTLFCVDYSGEEQNPDRERFGDSALLLYEESEEAT